MQVRCWACKGQKIMREFGLIESQCRICCGTGFLTEAEEQSHAQIADPAPTSPIPPLMREKRKYVRKINQSNTLLAGEA